MNRLETRKLRIKDDGMPDRRLFQARAAHAERQERTRLYAWMKRRRHAAKAEDALRRV